METAQTNMKSILFISVMNGSAWGGSEEQWYQLARWMCKNNYKVGVCVFDWEEKQHKLDELKNLGCRIFLLPHKGSGIFSNWKKNNILNTIPFNEYETAYVNQGGWHDIAHGPFKNLYKKLPPFALSFHNYQLGANLKSSTIAVLKKWISKSAVCIAATKVIYQMLENEYGITLANKEVSYSPVTFSPPVNLPARATIHENSAAVFLVLGALDVNRKAQDILIKCFGTLPWKNRNWKLNIYGEGKDRELLAALIKHTGLEEKIFLKGHSNDVKEILSGTDMLIQATHFDAMPISVIEAMAMGVPCLVSNIGDMPEWVKKDHNGFITMAVNETALSEQLEIAWAKRESWGRMGVNAYKTFLEKYPRPYEEKFAGLLEKYF